MKRKAASTARQMAIRKSESLGRIVEELVSHNREITQGKVTHLKVKCGKKNCRCAKGHKHDAHFLYVSRGGPLARIWIPKADRAWVEQRSRRYGKFRAIRAELNKTFKEVIKYVDQLETALTVPYEKKKS